MTRHVRVLSMGSRTMPPDSFTSIASALMQRRRLAIVYHGRQRDTVTERTPLIRASEMHTLIQGVTTHSLRSTEVVAVHLIELGLWRKRSGAMRA